MEKLGETIADSLLPSSSTLSLYTTLYIHTIWRMCSKKWNNKWFRALLASIEWNDSPQGTSFLSWFAAKPSKFMNLTLVKWRDQVERDCYTYHFCMYVLHFSIYIESLSCTKGTVILHISMNSTWQNPNNILQLYKML